MENNHEKDKIAKAEHEMKTQKVQIEILKDQKQNEINKANADYELVLQQINQVFEKDMVEVERIRREMEEKKKKAQADAKVHLDRVLDSIEAKY
jgi:hypothetical protein